MSNLLSYASILNDRDKFRKSGTLSGGEFNLLDTPSNKYFKILFYFDNGDVNGETLHGASSGLLAPTWKLDIKENEYYLYNSAWSYLKMNYEDERADMLIDFVNLLSNINCESPWYFHELSGLDSALDRPQVSDFKFEETRQKISIKCLSDAYDDRIATLLDLYRAIVWSWTMKREVLPSNLRKFDMGIFIFNDPVIPFHHHFNKYGSVGGQVTSEYVTSYKYIELHNCEIDYNSSKSGIGSINQESGLQPEYTIDIFFDDCYETRYNESSMKILGDMISWDTKTVNMLDQIDFDENLSFTGITVEQLLDYYGEVDRHEPDHKELTANKVTKTLPKTGFLTSVASELVGHAEEFVKSKINKVVLGNLYNFSLSQGVSQVKQALSGHVFSTANAIKSYTSDDKKSQIKYVNKIGNIYQNQTIANNI